VVKLQASEVFWHLNPPVKHLGTSDSDHRVMAWLAPTCSLITNVQQSCHSKTNKAGSLVLMDAMGLVVLAGNQCGQQEQLLFHQEKDDWKKGTVGWVCITCWVCSCWSASPCPFSMSWKELPASTQMQASVWERM